MTDKTCNHAGEKCADCTCQPSETKDDFLNLAPPAFKPQYLKPNPRGETAYSIRVYTAEDEKWFEELGY